jgi:methionyl aminopeptidase
VNEVVCHGIPKESEHLKTGSIERDITQKGGLIADSSKMYLIGDGRLARLAVKKPMRPGRDQGGETWRNAWGHWPRHSVAVEGNGYSVVREYCGHGVGKEMHEDPQVLHYGKPGEGAVLKEGMVFTIEPMVNRVTAGSKKRWLDGGHPR